MDILLSEKRIVAQAAFYPMLAAARASRIRDKQRMSENDRFRAEMAEALQASPLSQTALARLLGLPSQSAVSNILKGKRKVSVAEAAEIRRHLEMVEGPPVQLVPIIGLASAGAWNEAVQMPQGLHPIPRGLAGPRAFAVTIRGDSMDKLLPEGGWAVIDPDQRSLFVGRVFLIQNEDGETTVKRYCGDPARFEPVSNNPGHRELDLAEVAYTVIGRVISYGNTAGLG